DGPEEVTSATWPWFLKLAESAKKLRMDAPSPRRNMLSGRLFHTVLLAKSKPSPVAVTVPELWTVRPSSMEKKPPGKVAWAVAVSTVWPLPVILPLVQVH